MKALVAGAAGFIGSTLPEKLAAFPTPCTMSVVGHASRATVD